MEVEVKQKKINGMCIWIAIILAFIFCGCSNSEKTAETKEVKKHPYTQLCGDGLDYVNVYIYFYGDDLEDISHVASEDIKEIAQNNISENVRIYFETNGGRNWKPWEEKGLNISNESVQRYEVSNKGIKVIENDLGPIDLDVKENLLWFIRDTYKIRPAERNILILWGHGNGSYLWQNKRSLPNGLTPQDFDEVLSEAGVKFEVIGFDCCSMANISMLQVASKHADYLIAASTKEPISGWNYTNWISMLSSNTSIPAQDYICQIVNDYVKSLPEEPTYNLIAFNLIDADYLFEILNEEVLLQIEEQLNQINDLKPEGVELSKVLSGLENSQKINGLINKMTIIYGSNQEKADSNLGLNVTQYDIERLSSQMNAEI